MREGKLHSNIFGQLGRVLALGQSRRMESQMILRDVCGESFTKNKSLLRHVREKHQGKKRTDNETRKRDVTDNEARKEGLLAGLYSETFGEQVRSIPQAVFRPPAEYVRMAMKGSFTKNKNLLSHVRTGHQGMKRTDNEKQGQKAGAPGMRQLGRM